MKMGTCRMFGVKTTCVTAVFICLPEAQKKTAVQQKPLGTPRPVGFLFIYIDLHYWFFAVGEVLFHVHDHVLHRSS